MSTGSGSDSLLTAMGSASGSGGAAAAGSDPGAGASGATAGAPAVAAATTPAGNGSAGTADWQARGYENEHLAKYRDGQFKTLPDLFKSYDEFGGLINKRTDEAKAAAEKAASLEERWKGVEPIIGAPKNEDGSDKPYDFGWSDDTAVAPELAQSLEGILRKHNLSEAVAKDIVPIAETYAAAVALGNREAEMIGVMLDYGIPMEEIEAELTPEFMENPVDFFEKLGQTKVGAALAQRFADVQKFWESRIGDNNALREAMYGVAARRDGIKFLELLRSDLTMIKNGAVGGTTAPETVASIKAEAAGNPDFYLQPGNAARLEAARRREMGDKADRPVAGGE